MNHSLICKNYYINKNNESISSIPEIVQFKLYFNAVHARDWYYNAMKYHALHIIKELVPNITLSELGNIVDLHYTTVIHYFKRYTPLRGHKAFISNNFESFIDNKIYPLKPKSHKEITIYGAFKPISLEEAKQYTNERAKQKNSKNKRQKPISAKDQSEKY